MNQVQNEASSTNTILIVLVLLAVVAFAVWFFGSGVAPAVDDGLNVDVNLPTGNTNGSGAVQTPGEAQ